MSGVPQGPAGQYGYVPQPAPQQGYTPPFAQPQPAPQPPQVYYPPPIQGPTGDPLADLLARSRISEKDAKRLVREQNREQRQRPAQSQPDEPPFTARELEEMDDDELDSLMRTYERGSREFRLLNQELERREADDELMGDGDEDEEVEPWLFRHVYVDDGKGGWVQVGTEITALSKDDFTDNIKSRYPFAKLIKYSKAEKNGVLVRNKPTTLQVRTDEEVEIARSIESRKRAEEEKKATAQALGLPTPQALPQIQAPPAASDEMKVLVQTMNAQMIELQRQNYEMIRAVVAERPKGDGSDKMIEHFKLAKEMFVEPLLAMNQNRGGGSDIKGALDLAGFMVSSSAQLAKQGGGGGGDGGGLLETIKGLLGPIIGQMQANQAAAAQQQPVASAQPKAAAQSAAPQGDPMDKLLLPKIAQAIQFLIAGKVKSEQLPRYIFRNFKDATQVEYLIGRGPQEFADLVARAAVSAGAPQQYLTRQDVQLGFRWVYEETQRMAWVLDYYEGQGMLPERARLLEWNGGMIVPMQNQQGQFVIGPAAEKFFAERFPAVAQAMMKMAAQADLPPEAVAVDADLPGEENAPNYDGAVVPTEMFPPQQPQQSLPPQQAQQQPAQPQLRIVKQPQQQPPEFLSGQ